MSPKVVIALHPPLPVKPNLTRSPTVISSYVNPHKNLNLLEALYQLVNKNALEPLENQNSLGFYNGRCKMETPETIRTSLQAEECVTSIDIKDAYFHIPILSQSRKYMRFHVQGQSYQFKALHFGLSTASTEFTVMAKEVKLMALQRDIRVHQYLDDWLVRATSHQTCLQHTQTLVALCRELGWLVNKKSELDPKQVFNFVDYQFNLKEGKVRPTAELWQALINKFRRFCLVLCVRSRSSCPS